MGERPWRWEKIIIKYNSQRVPKVVSVLVQVGVPWLTEVELELGA